MYIFIFLFFQHKFLGFVNQYEQKCSWFCFSQNSKSIRSFELFHSNLCKDHELSLYCGCIQSVFNNFSYIVGKFGEFPIKLYATKLLFMVNNVGHIIYKETNIEKIGVDAHYIPTHSIKH